LAGLKAVGRRITAPNNCNTAVRCGGGREIQIDIFPPGPGNEISLVADAAVSTELYLVTVTPPPPRDTFSSRERYLFGKNDHKTCNKLMSVVDYYNV
jgi:hypothetical protein